jgi:hypothetical protein
MALQERTRLYEFLARVNRVEGADRVVGMHSVEITEIYDDGTQEIKAATIGGAVPLDWAGLVALMHEDDRAALSAALAAAA